jgi:hypothetical protein
MARGVGQERLFSLARSLRATLPSFSPRVLLSPLILLFRHVLRAANLPSYFFSVNGTLRHFITSLWRKTIIGNHCA